MSNPNMESIVKELLELFHVESSSQWKSADDNADFRFVRTSVYVNLYVFSEIR